MHDGTTFTSAPILHTVANYTDADTYITCVGAERINGNNARDSLVGMTNEVRAYSDPITLGDMQTMVSYNCDAPCPMCLAKSAPTCQEYIPEAYIAKWEFDSAIYQGTISDQGANGLNIDLVNDQTSYDPVYVHNQGIYFDGTDHVRTNNVWTQANEESFTFETWIRPMDANPTGTLFSIEEMPNLHEFKIDLNGAAIDIDIHGTLATIPITAPTAEEWTYVGFSLMKTDVGQTRACAYVGLGPEACVVINEELNLINTGNTFSMGAGFKGMMKEASVLDWPKKGYEFSSVVQTVGCAAFNLNACTMCPATTGECISDCQKNEYSTTCAACLDPNCASCYGDTFDQCYECNAGFDFTYTGQSCPGECGNGVNEDYLGEQCDDGNDQENDGCSSACLIEPGFTCSEKTAMSPSV